MLHLADLHLGWTPAYLPEALARGWRQERDRRLAHAVAWALKPENGIDLVVIAGDLFESHAPEPGLVERVVAELRRLAEAGVGVVTVPGNHDEITYPDSVFRLYADHWPGLLVQNPDPAALGPVMARGKPVYVYSCAYTGGVTRAWPPVDAFPPRGADGAYHIGVFHGTLLQGDARSHPLAGDRSLPLDAQALASAGYDYVALGHIHRHERYRLGATTAVYCGPPDGKGFDDPGVGFYTVAQIDGGGVAVETVPVLTRRIATLEVDVGAFASAAELAAHLRLQLSGSERPILRVVARGVDGFGFDPEALAAELAPVCLHVEVVDETEGLDPGRLKELAAEPTLRGLVVARALAAIEQAPDEARRALLARALRLAMAALEGR